MQRREPHVRRPVARIQAAHQEQAAVRVLRPSAADVGQAQPRVHPLVVGLESRGLFQQLDRLVDPALLQVQERGVEAWLDVLPRGLDARLELLQRAFLVAESEEDRAEVVERL